MGIFRFFISDKYRHCSLFKPFFFFPVIVFGITLFFSIDLNGQGNLLLTPRRALFEGTKRSLDINLANIGVDTATYAISIVQIRMKDDGGFETIAEPDSGQRFADNFIRFFPRSVTLGPNESQVVKLQIVRTNQLTPGEYRSHLYFRSLPNTKPLGEEDKKAIDSTTISVQLIPIFGITTPVIIRVGESTTKVRLSDPGLEVVNDTTRTLRFVFNRTGNMSVFGDIAVDHVSPQGKVTRVGIANGVAVYTPNPIRRFQFNLIRVPGVDFRTGKLRITYSAPSDVKPARYAEAELVLQR